MNPLARFRATRWAVVLAGTALWLVAAVGHGYGYGVPRLSLPEMMAVADVIAVGKVVSVQDGWSDERKVFVWTKSYGMRNGEQPVALPSPAGRFHPPVPVMMRLAEMEVELTIKGSECVREGRIEFQFPRYAPPNVAYGAGIWFQDYKPGERWLVFLRRAERGLEPINPLGKQDLRIPDALVLSQELRGGPTEKVEQLFLWLLTHGDEGLTLDCLEWVEYPSMWISPETAKGMAFLLERENRDIRLRAAMALCHAHYPPAIPVLVADWDTRSKDDWLRRYSIEALRWCLTEDALPYYYPLLDHPDAEVRRGAGYAIRTVPRASNIPYLVRALDDPDLEVRYYAAYGLAEVTGEKSLRVATDVFEADEGKYIQHWKLWWAEGGAEKIHEQPGAAPVPTAVPYSLKEGAEETLPAPPPVEETVSRDDAVAQSRSYLLNLGIQVDGLAGLRKEPVKPYQEAKPGFGHCGESARLAWEVVFFLNESEGPPWTAIAYVDVEDGSLIGWGGSPEVEAFLASR